MTVESAEDICLNVMKHSRGTIAPGLCENLVPPKNGGRREGRVSATPAAPVQ
jgi:hypothetical protein